MCVGTAVAIAPSTTDGDDDDLNHIVCCYDITKTLCGKDSSEPLTDDDVANCVVCLELERNTPEYCPWNYLCPCA